jgi:hypothetical protein
MDDRVYLGLPSDRPDCPRPASSQELEQDDAHASGSAKDQDLLPWLDAGDRYDSKGRRTVVEHGDGVKEAEVIGHGNYVVDARDGLLRIAA